MQKEEKQKKGLQEQSKISFRRKPSKEDSQRKSSISSLNPVQKRRGSTLTNKEPRGKTLPEDKDELLIYYQTIPMRRFSSVRAYETIKRVVDERLESVEYSCACAVVCKELSDCIKTAVKKKLLCDRYNRYKLVCYVAVGQLKGSSLNCSSRAIWSPTADTFTQYIYKNTSLFAVCIVFAVYKE